MMKHTVSDIRLLIMTLLLTSSGGLAQDRTDADQHVERHVVIATDFGVAQSWGAANKVVNVKHLYFSGQPDSASFAEARKNGVDIVINLREPSELDWDEASAAKNAGLSYYNVPIARQGTSFDAAAIGEIAALVRRYNEKEILLHCSSGNRAAAWLAIHLSQDHHMDIDSAVSLAGKAGLSNSVIEERIRRFLSDNIQIPE